MQPESTNSLFFRVPDDTTREDALEWLTGRTVELVSRPETLLGVGEYGLRSLEAPWLELVCAPSPSPMSTGMLGPWLGIAESIAQNWDSQVIGLSVGEGTLSLVAARGISRPRRLEYGPGHGWTISEGVAQAWERTAFFSDDARAAALNQAGGWLRGWNARQAIAAAYKLDEVKVGSLLPAPPADVVERILQSLGIKRSVLKRIPLWLPPGPHVEIIGPLDSSFPENLRRAWIGLRLPVAGAAATESLDSSSSALPRSFCSSV